MAGMDIFSGDAFSLRSLTAAINKRPYKPSRLGDLRLFTERGVTTTAIAIERKNGVLALVQTSKRGGPGSTLGREKADLRSLIVPHLQKEGQVVADEVQGVRAFGTESELQTVEALVMDRMAMLRMQIEVTIEFLRMGALKGLILDADLSTIYNLFTEFGVTQQSYAFAFDDEDLDVRNGCTQVLRLMEDKLGAASYSNARALCSPSFFDALVGHPQVKETFKYQQGQVNRTDLRRNFAFGDVIFEEYRGKVGNVEFIEDGTAYCFPEGAVVEGGPLFQTYYAPADFIETVNTIGLPFYAKQAVDAKYNRFVDLHVQSNPLPLCLVPDAVIKLTAPVAS